MRRTPRSTVRLALYADVAGLGMLCAIGLGLGALHQPPIVGDWTGLVDVEGRPTQTLGLATQHKLVAYGYTACPAACPATLTKMHLVLDALGVHAPRVTPIFITLDPAHDTPVVLGAYVQRFDRRILALTGERLQLQRSADRLGVLPPADASPTTPDGGPNHAIRLYLLAPNDALLQSYTLEDATALISADLMRRLPPRG